MRSVVFGRIALLLSGAAVAACGRQPVAAPAPTGARPAAGVEGNGTNGRSIEDSVRTLERLWADAIRMRDSTALERLVAPEFTVSSAAAAATRPPVPRAVWMENTLRRLRVDSIRLTPALVTVRGDTAVAALTFVWAGQFLTTPPFRDSTELTDTWVRSADAWRVHRRVLAK